MFAPRLQLERQRDNSTVSSTPSLTRIEFIKIAVFIGLFHLGIDRQPHLELVRLQIIWMER